MERYNKAENSLFVQFMIHSAVNELKAPGTVKTRLATIRAFHLTSGLPAPIACLPQVPLTLTGLKKRYGNKERRSIVTPAMLRWLKSHLSGAYLSPEEATLQWAAVNLAFFYRLRASEYLDAGYVGFERGLRGRDLSLTKEGRSVRLSEIRQADELTLFIRGSKTDVYNRGEYRNHYRTGLSLCPVTAAIELFEAFPSRFPGGPEADDLLFRDPLPRALITVLIQKAAEALGEPEGSLGTHSLCFGGASALWAAFGNAALVKRFGRWSSESYQTYIWDAQATSRDVAKGMAQADLTPR